MIFSVPSPSSRPLLDFAGCIFLYFWPNPGKASTSVRTSMTGVLKTSVRKTSGWIFVPCFWHPKQKRRPFACERTKLNTGHYMTNQHKLLNDTQSNKSITPQKTQKIKKWLGFRLTNPSGDGRQRGQSADDLIGALASPPRGVEACSAWPSVGGLRLRLRLRALLLWPSVWAWGPLGGGLNALTGSQLRASLRWRN